MAEASTSISHSHEKPNFFIRWFMSTNHKDIGILYIITAALFGFISVAFTVYMRLELMEPGVQYMTIDGEPNGHLWNVLITGHGVLMMFFVVIPALFGGFGNYFNNIIPCGLENSKATSINDLGLDVTFSDFDKALRCNFEKLLKNI